MACLRIDPALIKGFVDNVQPLIIEFYYPKPGPFGELSKISHIFSTKGKYKSKKFFRLLYIILLTSASCTLIHLVPHSRLDSFFGKNHVRSIHKKKT